MIRIRNMQKVSVNTVWKYCDKCEATTPHKREMENSDPDDPVTYYKCDNCDFISL